MCMFVLLSFFFKLIPCPIPSICETVTLLPCVDMERGRRKKREEGSLSQRKLEGKKKMKKRKKKKKGKKHGKKLQIKGNQGKTAQHELY